MSALYRQKNMSCSQFNGKPFEKQSGLALVVELIYTYLNSKFDIGIIFTANYSFSGCDVLIDSEMFLVTDFVNLNIKPAQCFRDVHMSRLCVHVFIGVSARTCMSICVYIVFFKKQLKKLEHF
jgi:hypothetical protein